VLHSVRVSSEDGASERRSDVLVKQSTLLLQTPGKAPFNFQFPAKTINAFYGFSIDPSHQIGRSLTDIDGFASIGISEKATIRRLTRLFPREFIRVCYHVVNFVHIDRFV
jgi:hypothetical protein